MAKIYLGCLAVLLVLIAPAVIAFIYMPLGNAMLATWAYVAFWISLFLILSRLLSGRTQELATTLQDMEREQADLMSAASTTVHRFEEVPRPSAEAMKDQQPIDPESEPYRFMLLDCTVAPPVGEENSWEPGLLRLQQPNPEWTPPKADEDEQVDDGIEEPPVEPMIYASRVFMRILDTEERELEVPEMLQTPARLRMVYACPAKMKGAVNFNSWHTRLCELNLPPI